jgi:dimethylargininase
VNTAVDHPMSGPRFSRAIVRPPGRNFAEGLTTAGLGPPDLALALEQHRAYRGALRRCGLEVIELPPDEERPDSTFVEDTAVLTGFGAMITRPGAASRRDETAAIRTAILPHFPGPESIHAPGTLDGGDICDADGIVLIGLSERTNEAGASQLADWLDGRGVESRAVDIRNTPGILHLKSGIASLGEGRLAFIEALAGRPELSGFAEVRVPVGEGYAANCLRINDTFLVPAGFPRFSAALRSLGRTLIELEMSEFQKMDGGLSCLSLRF